MAGVGSGSALNAFNIGQAATSQTAVGQQITAIVQQADKLGISQGAAGASAAGGIATAQAKSRLEAGKTKNIIGFNEEGPFEIARGVSMDTEAKSAIPQGFVDRETTPIQGGQRRGPFVGTGGDFRQESAGGAGSVGTSSADQAALAELLKQLQARLADPNLR